MPKRSARKDSGSPRAILILAASTLALFIAGESVILARTDSGRLFEARYLHIGDDARVTQLVSRQIRRGLEAAGVRRDSLREEVIPGGPARLRWRVGLLPGASLIQA